MSEWLPIETAPKDSTPILAYMPDRGLVYVVWWQTNNQGYAEWEEYAGEQFYTFHPTHWMPLPTPPAS